MAQSQDHTPLETLPGNISLPPEASAAFADATRVQKDSTAGNSDGQLANASKRLSNDILQSFTGNQRAEFQDELEAFLLRANQKHLSADEIVRTLDATSRLLEGKGASPLDQTSRSWLALSLMQNLCDPNRVDQGFHNTCNATCIAKVLMADDPAKMAEMVCNTALDGYYQAPDGKVITIDSQSLRADSEARGGETHDAKRNYASQVFDLVAINNYWQRRCPPFSYVQQKPEWAGDTGERLLNSFRKAMTDSSGEILTNPNLDCRAMAEIGREVGIRDRFLVANGVWHQAADATINSPESLAETLKSILAEGHPAMLFVESGNKLFTGRWGVDGGGGHVVTIDSYDPSTGQFHMSNQWGAANDQMVSIADLYDATLPANMWAYCPDYHKSSVFESYLLYMAGGGAGLDRNQIKSKEEVEKWLAYQKEKMRKDALQELSNLQSRLNYARATRNNAEVTRLEDWISQTTKGLQ